MMKPRERKWKLPFTFAPLSLHFCCTSVPVALRKPVRLSLAREPDILRRTLSARYLTAKTCCHVGNDSPVSAAAFSGTQSLQIAGLGYRGPNVSVSHF